MLAFLVFLHFFVMRGGPLWAWESFEAQRERMVRVQIQERDVSSRNLLVAMRAVPRHLFVPADLARYAYDDRPLPIGEGQTISQPYIVALMTEYLDLQAADRVFEVGTGSGYQAAVLSLLAKRVYTIEINRPLGEQAARRLRSLGYKNVEVRIGNGYAGWPEQAPFEKIILTAAPPEVPQVLIDQLKPGGRLVAPVGEPYHAQELVVLEKSRSGRISTRKVLPVAFVPMIGK